MSAGRSAVLTVAGHELRDARRSRRALVLLLLYFAGAAAATLLFVKVLREAETQVARSLGLDATRRAGSVSATLWKSRPLRDGLVRLAGDEALAQYLLAIPPLALFYGWLSFTFAPLLVMLLGSTRIAVEVWSGAARFALFRVSRLSWCLGKYLGQALQLLAALLLSAAGAWLIGWARLEAFEPLSAAVWVFVFAVKAWIYSLAFLGLALGLSQVCAGPNLAAALGFGVMIGMGVVNAVAGAQSGPGWRRLWEAARLLTPGGHKFDLWRGDLAHVLPAAVFCGALGLAYLAVGYARFARKDL